jgi:N-methylhydantoinase B/oxoprolinase/acetone carboxylase alpha subunit
LVLGHTEFGSHIHEAVVRALAPAIPEKIAAAGPDTFVNFTGGGVHPRSGEFYAFYWPGCGGCGARATKDGNDALGALNGNPHNISVEALEVKYPWRVEEVSLREDSGGPGEFRGGLGTVREYRLLADTAKITMSAERGVIPPWGIFGGQPGAPTVVTLTREGEEAKPLTEYGSLSPTKVMGLEMLQNDVMKVASPGGGGYGNPLDREPEKVRRDVLSGYVSTDSAEEDYGVVVDPVEREIDREATVNLRKKSGQPR